MARRRTGLILLVWLALAFGCARPYVYPPPAQQVEPALLAGQARMDDGFMLPFRQWAPDQPSRAVVLAVHGLTDYSHAFADVGHYLAQQSMHVYAYDQRGFGATEAAGLWHGDERMVADLTIMLQLLRAQHPGSPLFLMGESMGGAVSLVALREEVLPVDGVVLLAPAVWSRNYMPWYQRLALWTVSHTFPAMTFSGRSLGIKASDNQPMLEAQRADPLIIKQTRADVLFGLGRLMDRAALVDAPQTPRLLVLYGQHDKIIPRRPACAFLQHLTQHPAPGVEVKTYAQGYHMLTRDLQGPQVWDDIGHWLDGVISGAGQADDDPRSLVAALCD